MIAGGVLAGITVVLPPAATNSDAAVIVLGAVALAVGVVLVLVRRDLGEWLLGAVAALGTILITVATYEGGGFDGAGTADNQMLYVWVCLFSVYCLSARNALVQIAIVGVAYGWLLAGQEVAAGDAATRWAVTMTAGRSRAAAWRRRPQQRRLERRARSRSPRRWRSSPTSPGRQVLPQVRRVEAARGRRSFARRRRRRARGRRCQRAAGAAGSATGDRRAALARRARPRPPRPAPWRPTGPCTWPSAAAATRSGPRPSSSPRTRTRSPRSRSEPELRRR